MPRAGGPAETQANIVAADARRWVLQSSLVFNSQAGNKRRPVVVVYDAVDADLLVAPITVAADVSRR